IGWRTVRGRGDSFRQIAHDKRTRVGDSKSTNDPRLINSRRDVVGDGYEEFVRFWKSVGFPHFLFGSDAGVRKMKLVGVIQVGTGENYFKLAANSPARRKRREQAR